MHLIDLSDEAVGRILGENLYDELGRILLRRGVELTRSYVKRLQSKGFKSVYVLNELAPDIEPEQVISNETRRTATSTIRDLSEKIIDGEAADTHAINEAVTHILDELQEQEDLIRNLTSIKSIDNYTFEHSVNVCILSLVILDSARQQASFAALDHLELGQGAMLHDIGKLVIPREILQKPGSLTEEEFEIVRRHPTAGHNILNEFEPDSLAPRVALSHHERIDGTGYPEGISGEEIGAASRIAAVADVYDAVTSDRAYRKRMQPVEAVDLLRSVAGTHLDAELVDYFTCRVAHYERGAIVRLNTDELAVVVSQDENSASQPVVRVVVDREERVLDEPVEIALSEEQEMHIAEALEDYPPQVLQQMS